MCFRIGELCTGTESFPGFSLVFDGKELISRNQDHHPGKVYEFVYLQAGKPYPLSLRYYQKETEYAIMRLLWDAPGRQLKQEAIQVASASDLVILCMGLSPSLEGERNEGQGQRL
jgi:beta-glucosidase